MKDDTKTNKPKIKVEEIEEVPEESKEESKTSILEPDKSSNESATTPKVSSFSQLDSAPAAPAEQTKEEVPAPKNEEVVEEKEKPKEEQISSDEVKEWLKEVRPDTTKENEKGRGPGAKKIMLIMLLLLILGAIVGGILYFQKGVENEDTQSNVKPSDNLSPTTTPVPTQAEEQVDLTTLSVSVLNGSGKTGEAGKVKNLLTEGGFSEEKITAGNADNTKYEGTTVSVKERVTEKVVEAIKTALSEEYTMTLSEDTLEESSTYDIVIIIGSETSE